MSKQKTAAGSLAQWMLRAPQGLDSTGSDTMVTPHLPYSLRTGTLGDESCRGVAWSPGSLKKGKYSKAPVSVFLSG